MQSQQYDVVIIGGGILGLSTAMQLAQRYPSGKIAVVEKESELASHQTGHNSGVIHSGIYYRPGSWKSKFCVAGVQKLVDFCDANEIEYDRCGKAIIATDESELGRLQDLYERGVANGVQGLEIVGPERLAEIEPHAYGVKALWAPRTGIVDYVRVAKAYASRFQELGGEIYLGAGVSNIAAIAGIQEVQTDNGSILGRHIINCAGLYADKVARLMGEETNLQIVPFRGEYYTLKPDSQYLVKGLIYPVPDPRFPFLGVHYTRNIHGQVEAGPNAVLAWSREGYKKSDIKLGESFDMLRFPGFWKMSAKHWKTGISEMNRSYRKNVFVRDLQKLIPTISGADLDTGGSGVRAQAVAKDGSLSDDFNILQGNIAVHVLNAPSPGATSSLAIGEYIVDLAIESFSIVEDK